MLVTEAYVPEPWRLGIGTHKIWAGVLIAIVVYVDCLTRYFRVEQNLSIVPFKNSPKAPSTDLACCISFRDYLFQQFCPHGKQVSGLLL
jgi:hypothetical protein